MTNEVFSYSSLLLIVFVAAVIPAAVNRIKFISIPIVVGEIVAGILIGKSGLNLVSESVWLDFLFKLGFAFLMFMSGLEINLQLIGPSSKKGQLIRQPFFVASILFLTTFILSFSIAFLLKIYGLIPNITLFVIVFCSTSVGIVVPILKEKGLLNEEYGQIILITALLADFSTMILLSLFVTLTSSSSVFEILLILLLIPAFFLVYKAGNKIMKYPMMEELAHKTSQIKVRGTIALLIMFMTLAQLLKTEMILGAFLAGLIVSLINDRDTSLIYRKLDAIGYGFFIPLFFIMVGVNFNAKDIINNPESMYLLPVFLAIIYFVNLIPSIFLRFIYSWKKSIAAAILSSSRLSLIIAAGTIGYKMGVISGALNATIILVAIITCTISPLLFNNLFYAQTK